VSKDCGVPYLQFFGVFDFVEDDIQKFAVAQAYVDREIAGGHRDGFFFLLFIMVW
jgi:hypothetical protein